MIGKAFHVLRASLAGEKNVERPRRNSDERAFLPAAIEILETPANPAGRTLAWLIIAFFVIAAVWAMVGQIDIHATAQGRIVPAGRVKVIEPLETGTVAGIHVRDGDRVKAGDPLIDIDRTEAAADRERLSRDLMTASVELKRLEAQVNAALADTGAGPPEFEPPVSADPLMVAGQRQMLASAVATLHAELATIEGEIRQRQAERNGARRTQDRQTALVDVLRERMSQREELAARGAGSRSSVLEVAQVLHEEEANLARTVSSSSQAAAAIDALRRRKAERRATFLSQAVTEREEVRKHLAGLREELKKAVKRDELMHLTAPVDGTVLQLAVHTLGSVVTSGEQLMVIVPEGVGLEVEAMVLNKDKGFVDAGAHAAVKLEAFPFTKYGTIDGQVQLVSNDAVEDQALGLVFPARVSLARETIRADGADVALSPGMSVTVEVKTGKRRVVEYVLSPLLRYRDEAIRER